MTPWKLEAVDFKSENASSEFSQFIRNTGFGIIENHPIDPQLIKDVYAEWNAFFHNPQRFDYLFDPNTHDGYIPFEKSETAQGCQKKDLKEFYHLYAHGRYPAMLSNKTKLLMEKMLEISSTLLNWLEENLPDDIRSKLFMPLSDMIIDSPRTLLRILHYPPLTGSEDSGAVRAAAHNDVNLITVLPAASAEGLQALGNDGKWHPIPCNSDYLVINIADMLQESVAGYYQSTLHRVVNPEGDAAKVARISTPFFLHAKPEVRLSEQYTAASYWEKRQREIGLDK